MTFEKSEANGRITDPGRFIEIDVVKPAVDAVSSDPMPYGYYGYCESKCGSFAFAIDLA